MRQQDYGTITQHLQKFYLENSDEFWGWTSTLSREAWEVFIFFKTVVYKGGKKTS